MKGKNRSQSISGPKTVGNYLLRETIGQGTFGKVKLCTHIPSNSTYAVKILPREKERIITAKKVLISREISILTQLKHPNIISLKEIVKTTDHFYIVMEYCPCGELFSLVSKKKCIPEEEASFYFYQLINGIEFLHSKGITHRDIKLENVLLLESGIIKIIDFGLSNYFTENMLLRSSCGSPSYAAPEMLLKRGYDGRSVDVWSSGIILFAMLCGFLPFSGKDDKSLFEKIINGNYSFPDKVSALAKSLIKRLLHSDWERRIKIDQIKQHQFYIKGKTIYMQTFPSKNKKRSISSIQSYCQMSKDNAIDKVNDGLLSHNDDLKLQMKTQINEEHNCLKDAKEREIAAYDKRVKQNKGGESKLTTETPNYLKWNKEVIHTFGLRLKIMRDRKREKKEKLSFSVRQSQANAKTPVIAGKDKIRSIMKQLVGREEATKSPYHNGCETDRVNRESLIKRTNNYQMNAIKTIAKASDFEKNQLAQLITQREQKRNFKGNPLVISLNGLKKDNGIQSQ